MRNELEVHWQKRRLFMEAERQKALMRVAAAHLEHAEEARKKGTISIQELLARLRPDSRIAANAEPEAI
jgi:hypothetical protein